MDDSATPSQLTILVANDQEWAARSFESILVGPGYRVVRAYNGRQALERAASSKPDAVILDMQMPDLDGLTVCQTLRSWPEWSRSTPIFITTAGPSGRQERFAAYRAGAWEFFGYPIDPEAILMKLQVFLDAKTASDASREEGLIDEASGLYNRRGLMRRGAELCADAARRKERVSCVVLRPKEPVGSAPIASDGLARQLGEVLRRAGRSSDAIGRLGPLQFAVVAVGAGEVLGQQLVDRVNDLAARSGLGSAIGHPELTFCAKDYPVAAPGSRLDWDQIAGPAVRLDLASS